MRNSIALRQRGCPVVKGFVFFTHFWDCSVKTVQIGTIVYRQFFPPLLLLSVPRDNGLVARKTGCPLSPNLIIINSATLSHSPPGLSLLVEYHFFSDPGPRNDQRPGGNFLACIETRPALALHSHLFSSDHHEMSLNIDMKMIRPLNSDGSLILDMNSWTVLHTLQCSESWENITLEFHRFSVNCVQSSEL